MTSIDDAHASLFRQLSRTTTLDSADFDAIRALPFEIRSVPANHFIIRAGETPLECGMLVEGFACRHKSTSRGARQIVAFNVPGDLLDLQHLLLARADHNLQTITAAHIAFVPAQQIRELARERPAVGEAMWQATLIEASIFREWVLNIGRRDSRSRLAHMLCEFALRREAAGLGPPERFELPMTQEQIGDATGMTSVHVNRMLHELAIEGAIVRRKRHVQIVDWARMRRIADFDPAYLHAAA